MSRTAALACAVGLLVFAALATRAAARRRTHALAYALLRPELFDLVAVTSNATRQGGDARPDTRAPAGRICCRTVVRTPPTLRSGPSSSIAPRVHRADGEVAGGDDGGPRRWPLPLTGLDPGPAAGALTPSQAPPAT